MNTQSVLANPRQKALATVVLMAVMFGTPVLVAEAAHSAPLGVGVAAVEVTLFAVSASGQISATKIQGTLVRLEGMKNVYLLRVSLGGAGVIIAIVGLVAVSIVLLVGYVILASVQNSIPTTSLTTTQQTNLASLMSSATNGYLLAGIVVLVLAAAVILGVLFRGFMGSGQI